jgi:integrase
MATTVAANNTVIASEKITSSTTTKSKSSSSRIITPDIETKIDSLTAGALPYFNSIFKQIALVNQQNAEILCEFITAEYNERNVKFSTRLVHIKIISSFDRYLNYKDFLHITKHNIMQYLSTLRKTESEDPTHKWIGTYNTRQMVLSKFFKWLYNQNEPDCKKRVTPPCMQGIKTLPRKEKSPYKPSDIWTNEEHAIFLKYCPEKRDKCYHSMANDTSARPHELLCLRIKDIVFKMSSTGMQYAEVHIVESKTKPRTLPLIFSIPYLKDWIDSHHMNNNQHAFLFPSLGDFNFGKQLSENALYKQYTRNYKKRYFPKLLEDPSIPDRDKAYIKNMLTKPWNPYIQRHSALTAKSQILKESTLRDHAGWSMTSKMPNVYLHYFGNESSKSLLEAYGIESYQQKQIELLKTKPCPNCSEPNKPDSKFCAKCRMVLTYDAYSETLEKQQEKESEVQNLKGKYEQDMKAMREEMENKFQQILAKIDVATLK